MATNPLCARRAYKLLIDDDDDNQTFVLAFELVLLCWGSAENFQNNAQLLSASLPARLPLKGVSVQTTPGNVTLTSIFENILWRRESDGGGW